MQDYIILKPNPSNETIFLLESITKSARPDSPQPSCCIHDDKYKTRAEFMEDIILRYSNHNIPDGLSPEERREAIDSILNDPKVKHRFIFSHWPRPHAVIDWNNLGVSPHPVIKPGNSLPGKMAPNGIELWGSTLFDFFTVQRMAGLVNQQSLSSGSKLLRWCKANGEYEGENAVAKQAIAWAEKEKDSEVVPVYNVADLIRNLESSEFPDEHTPKEEDEDDGMQEDTDSDTTKKRQSWPPKSVFDSAAYPEPWTDAVPFSKGRPWCSDTLPVLEEYIPQSRLPQNLIVHDPYDLLPAEGRSRYCNNAPWNEQVQDNPGSVHTYELRLSDKPDHSKKRRRADEKYLGQKEIYRKRVLDNFLANPHSSTPQPVGLEIMGSYSHPINVPIKPAIYVIVPPRPQLAAASEAHLYISPRYQIGTGNHSFVYGAEWELPRSCLVEEQICIHCVMEDVQAIVREQDGENGETRDAKWDELSGKMVVKHTSTSPATIMVVNEKGEKILNSNEYVLQEGEHTIEVVYEGPYRVIHSRVKYQNLARAPYCKHLRKLTSSIHPLTTKVRVVAKLSIKGDKHLAREAENYQQFPKHFFEHWSGYNLLPPIHDPVPVGPLVPQFYGYYVPKEDKEAEEEEKSKSYLSPILLQEHCGKPIIPDKLSIDDKHECAGLGLRLHEAMWVHGSFFRRNILGKPGPLSAHPDQRAENKRKRGGYGVDWSYRLIDFGRSQYVGDVPSNGFIESLDAEHQDVRNWALGYVELR